MRDESEADDKRWAGEVSEKMRQEESGVVNLPPKSAGCGPNSLGVPSEVAAAQFTCSSAASEPTVTNSLPLMSDLVRFRQDSGPAAPRTFFVDGECTLILHLIDCSACSPDDRTSL